MGSNTLKDVCDHDYLNNNKNAKFLINEDDVHQRSLHCDTIEYGFNVLSVIPDDTYVF